MFQLARTGTVFSPKKNEKTQFLIGQTEQSISLNKNVPKVFLMRHNFHIPVQIDNWIKLQQ